MKLIPLTQGKHAVVDDDDYEKVVGFKWYAHWTGWNWYARRVLPRNGRRQAFVRMHNVIFPCEPGFRPDHKNGDGLDNRKSNLRPATKAQNARNRDVSSVKKSSRFKGVYPSGVKWRARIRLESKIRHLGTFDSEIAAAQAYDSAAKMQYGEFAYLNVSAVA